MWGIGHRFRPLRGLRPAARGGRRPGARCADPLRRRRPPCDAGPGAARLDPPPRSARAGPSRHQKPGTPCAEHRRRKPAPDRRGIGSAQHCGPPGCGVGNRSHGRRYRYGPSARRRRVFVRDPRYHGGHHHPGPHVPGRPRRCGPAAGHDCVSAMALNGSPACVCLDRRVLCVPGRRTRDPMTGSEWAEAGGRPRRCVKRPMRRSKIGMQKNTITF